MWLIAGKFAVILPIVAFLLNNFVGAYVFAQKNRNRVNRTFLLFTLNAAGWLGFEFLLYFPLSDGFETQWWRWTSIFWISIGVLYLEFANALVGKRRNALSYIGFVTAAAGYGVTGFTDLVFTGVTHYDWGTAPVCNPIIHTVVSANTALFTLIGAGVLVNKGRITEDTVQKKVIRLLLIGTVVASSTIALVNVILPNFFGIQNLPRYGASALAVFMVLIFYAIIKYQFLAISPHEVAEEIYDGVKVGILLLDVDGRITRANREATTIFGSNPMALDCADLFAGVDISGEFVGKEFVQKKNGENRVLTLSASKVVHRSQWIGTILMVQDITAQKSAEAVLRKSRDDLEREVELRTAQLRRAQRMETIGTLAGGIAHDFNNSLAAILGFSKAALMDLPEGDPIRQDLNEVILAANRGKDMVNQIMNLARKENKSDFKRTNMASLLHETIKLQQISTPEHVAIQTHIHLEFPFVSGAPTQLSQVITNLYTNACHAMKNMNSGTLTLTLENVEIAERTDLGTAALRSGRYVCLRIADTGTGIRQSDISHVFDPFFTTKSRDEGTGLGLSSAQVIIHNHDGEITVDSQEGIGTTFAIYLPVQEQDENRTSSPPPRISDYGTPVAGEQVLWVDDKPQILRMGKRMLSQLGYTVATAEGGQEALSIFRDDPDGFCLVITDYSMPDLTGTDLAVELRKINAHIPVILLSGYGEAVTDATLEECRINAFLKKPVEAKELTKTIHHVLRS